MSTANGRYDATQPGSLDTPRTCGLRMVRHSVREMNGKARLPNREGREATLGYSGSEEIAESRALAGTRVVPLSASRHRISVRKFLVRASSKLTTIPRAINPSRMMAVR